jgi:hypothetical protein
MSKDISITRSQSFVNEPRFDFGYNDGKDWHTVSEHLTVTKAASELRKYGRHYPDSVTSEQVERACAALTDVWVREVGLPEREDGRTYYAVKHSVEYEN